ncbi:sulfotransferase [Clostridium sp. BL-8]|uniref:sulfotransferase n=1 Tax=Clostridium sp. BL-8 TaxID=349938 RepID=UPI0009CAC483|nr:sulfotransferase [Clostridium sp. BL-8]OOM80319.1 hypothetical protein CLOBL_09750 [Clostridium sp. BL-8]
MIIGVCGYGATGSSAVVGLLKEFSGLQVYDDAEFKYAYKVDGLQDLEYHLVKQYSRHVSGDMAIKRFLYSINYAYTPFVKKSVPKKAFIELSRKYADSLIQAKWKGIESADYEVGFLPKSMCNLGFKKIIFPNYERIFKKTYDMWPARELYLSIEPEDFYKKTKDYIRNLLLAMGADLSKPIVLDQPFEGNAPQNSFSFFDNPKAIVVDRDPRDLFLVSKYAVRAKGEARFMPRTDVKKFVEYYRQLRIHQKRVDNENIIFVRFEDLIYNYEHTVKRIATFLNLGTHNMPKEYFKPEISISNTQLHNKYMECKDEVEYIEKELSEYLFPYENYKKITKFGKTF